MIATNTNADSDPSTEATGTPDEDPGQVHAFIENEVVTIHEDGFPWLRDTWDYITSQNVDVEFLEGSTSVVFHICNPFSYLTPCEAQVQIGRNSPALIHTITHELGHVYTLSGNVTNEPGPLAIAHVYFWALDVQQTGCWSSELYADMLMILVHGDPAREQNTYWSHCTGTNDTLTEEALAVVESAVAGDIPSWFADTYHDTDGEPDLERLWADVKDINRRAVVIQLRDAFGGYCDDGKAAMSAFGDGVTRNPWRDGGCVPEAPGNLAVTATDEGEMTVSWTAPDYDGGSPIEGYKVQWKSGSQEYDPSRQADVTDLAGLSHTIPGLTDGVEYTVRVLAYNTNGDGAASVEKMATAQTPPEANEAPEFPLSETGERSVPENTSAGINIGAPVAATDADNDTLTYTLGGTDAASFDIVATSGQLWTSAPLDYETKSSYSFTVSVHDGDGDADSTIDDTIAVTIQVTDVDEDGTVSLFPAQLQVGSVLRATLGDPDSSVSSVSWRWAKSSDKSIWGSISGAYEASYTPVSGDQGMYIRATATYTDGEGSGKTAEVVSDNTVGDRAPAPKLSVVTLISGLTIPWGIAFTPDGTMLFTERRGMLSSHLANGTVQTVTAELGDLYASGETGFMAIVVDPDFASNRRFYTCQGHTGPEVQVIAWTINATYTTATRVADPLVGDIPTASMHGGCRLRFGPQGYLWIATGDAALWTVPQDLNSLGGKILRVDASTGAGAPGNPFASRVYTYGHRNPQGLALRPGTSQMWSVEHGPAVDDEINLLARGGNYGWDPIPGYNQGVPMTDLEKFPDAIEAKWSSGIRPWPPAAASSSRVTTGASGKGGWQWQR